MDSEYITEAKEWLSFAVNDLGVAMWYPNELFLEERHAEKAVQMAKEFVVWAKSIVYDAGDDEHV